MGESAVKRPHTPNSKVELAFAEQPENKHEISIVEMMPPPNLYAACTSQTSSQQVIHNNPPLVRKS
jgi:hypothetical protein